MSSIHVGESGSAVNVFVILHSDGLRIRGVTTNEQVMKEALEALNKDFEMSGSHTPPFNYVEWPMSDTLEHLMKAPEQKKELEEYNRVLEQVKKLSPQMQAKLFKEQGR